MKKALIFFTGVALLLSSCDRIKGLGSKVIGKAKSTIDEYLPAYDAKVPDTKYNKKRFKEFFGFHPTEDVINLYAHADELGIDASYYFAFTSDKVTIERIIKELELKQDTTHMSFSGSFNLPYTWWNPEIINKLKPVSKVEKNTYWYLWYDRKSKQTYFLTFDI